MSMQTIRPKKKWVMTSRDASLTGIGRKLVTTATVAGTALLLIYLPHLAGMSWHGLIGVLGGVSATTLIALAALWLLGLWAHTYVLTAALPGLSRPRALLLNLSGSAVSNLFPFGGAAGMGLGFAMARTWRFSPAQFASFTAISNLWNVVGKLFVGAALVALAIVAGVQFPASIQGTIILGSGGLMAAMVVVVLALTTPTMMRAIGRLWDRTVNGLLAQTGSLRRIDAAGVLERLRQSCAGSISAGWGQMTFGILAYMALQAALLAACLHAVGAHTSLLVIVAAFGVERVLSLFPLTPGGAGVTELGTVGVLLALGGDPVLVTAGVLLYRLYTFLLEIPVGGASAIVWMLRRPRRASVDPPCEEAITRIEGRAGAYDRVSV